MVKYNEIYMQKVVLSNPFCAFWILVMYYQKVVLPKIKLKSDAHEKVEVVE